MSCEGCITSSRGQQEALNIILKQAKDYAKENNITVAVYKEGLEYKFIEAGAAITGGYQIIDMVSQY
jgi:hypothetical protein